MTALPRTVGKFLLQSIAILILPNRGKWKIGTQQPCNGNRAETRHKLEECTMKMLHACAKSRKLNLLEQLEIDELKEDKDLLNSQLEN